MFQKNRDNPTLFYKHILGYDYWSIQAEITKSAFQNQRTIVASCNAAGKTSVIARIALNFLFTYPDSIVLTTAKTQRQVYNSLWREIRGAYYDAKVDLGGELLKTRFDLNPNWYAIGMATNEPDNMRGFHAKSGHMLILVDEAGKMDTDILNALEGNVTSNEVHIVYIGNPTAPYGRFHDAWQSSLWNKIHITVFDTPNFKANNIKTVNDLRKFSSLDEMHDLVIPIPQLVTPQWAWGRLHEWGESNPVFRSLVLAEFPNISDNSLIPLNEIMDAVDKELPKEEHLPFISIGVDVARFGSDDTVITVLDNHELQEMKWHNGKDTMKTVGEVIAIMNKYTQDHGRYVIMVDDTGVGGGVVDRLREQGYNVVPVNFGEKADDPMYMNKKAEIFFITQSLFKQGKIKIQDVGKLIAHLSSIQYDYTSSGSLIIVSKDKMKAQGLPSPDFADSFALACYGLSHRYRTTIQQVERGGTISGNLMNTHL